MSRATALKKAPGKKAAPKKVAAPKINTARQGEILLFRMNKAEESSWIYSRERQKEPLGLRWTAKGWVADVNVGPTLAKYGLLPEDEDLLRIFDQDGGLPRNVPPKQSNRFFQFQQAGIVERKYTNKGVAELMEEGLPAAEVDRFVLSRKGQAALDAVNKMRDAAQRAIDNL